MKRTSLIIAATAIAFVFSGTATWSYLSTASNKLVSAAKDAIPIEFEIDRARTLVEEMLPQIRKTIRVVATEEVELARLSGQINDGRRELVANRGQIKTVRETLDRKQEFYVFDSQRFSPEDLRQDLATKFNRYRRYESEIASLESIREARKISLKAARTKLAQLVEAKNQLTLQVEELHSQWAATQAHGERSPFAIDRTTESQAKRAIEHVRGRIAVAEQILKTEIAVAGQIETDSTTQNIVEMVDNHFGKPAGKVRLANNQE